MAAPVLAPIAPRLARLVPFLASDREGEVLATVRAIGRTLAGAGLDFHALAAALESAPGPQTDPPRSGFPAEDPDAWHALAVWCESHHCGRLRPNEREFIGDMVFRLEDHLPTEKQAAWLRAIARRLGWRP